MNIESALNNGLQGFKNATALANQAATEIASPTTLNDSVSASQSSDNVQTGTNLSSDITQSIVNLKVAEHQAKASASVIASADETLGTLLDVRV